MVFDTYPFSVQRMFTSGVSLNPFWFEFVAHRTFSVHDSVCVEDVVTVQASFLHFKVPKEENETSLMINEVLVESHSLHLIS